MKLSWVIQANFLILGLGLVLYMIFHVGNSGLPPTMLNLLGIQLPSMGAGFEQRLTWCETRVQSMEKPNGFRIYQDKFKWFASGPPQREVDFIAVEKWFGRNCSLEMESMAGNSVDQGSFQTALVVNFIKGTAERLFKLEPNVYVWRGQVFRSSQLESALQQLELLPTSDTKK